MALARIFAIIALALGFAGIAHAQVPDPQARDLARRLAQAERSLDETGFALAAGPFVGAGARDGAVQRFEVTLRTGHEYRIVGFCDAACDGLALRLAESGDVLVRGGGGGGAPVLDALPQRTGVFVIEARLRGCEAAQCYYAFNIFSR